MKAAALIFRAAISFCPAQDRRPTEEAAMLIRLDFYQNSFLKKDCAQQVTAPATSMNYTI